MKKILKTIFVVFSVSFFAQSREELNKAMLSNNQTEISEFIQKYPKNPNVPFLKKKMGMAKNSNSPSVNQNADPINKEKVVKQIDKFVEKKEQTGKTMGHRTACRARCVYSVRQTDYRCLRTSLGNWYRKSRHP